MCASEAVCSVGWLQGEQAGGWQSLGRTCVCLVQCRTACIVWEQIQTLVLLHVYVPLCCRLLKLKVWLQTAGSACSNKQCGSGLQHVLAGSLAHGLYEPQRTPVQSPFAAASSVFCSGYLPVAAAFLAGPHAQVISLRAFPPAGRCCCCPAALPPCRDSCAQLQGGGWQRSDMPTWSSSWSAFTRSGRARPERLRCHAGWQMDEAALNVHGVRSCAPGCLHACICHHICKEAACHCLPLISMLGVMRGKRHTSLKGCGAHAWQAAGKEGKRQLAAWQNRRAVRQCSVARHGDWARFDVEAER